MPRVRAASLRLLVVTGAVVALAGCGGSPGSSGGATASDATAPSVAASASPSVADSGSPAASDAASAQPSGSGSASGSTLAVTATEYAFQAPTTIQAGVTTISLQNAGKEEHQAQLVRIDDGKTFDDLTAALATGDPTAALKLVQTAGGPNLVQPGATGVTTQNLKAGTYAFLCFISGSDNVPHLAKGMIAPLTVTGTDTADEPPAGDATVTAKDFTFDVAATTTGEHTFTFRNDGPQPHEAGLVKLAPGMTAEQIKAVFASIAAGGEAPSGPPPWQDAGGIGAIAPGTTATFTVNLEAGSSYAFICFVPDPASGKAHAELGMIADIPTQ